MTTDSLAVRRRSEQDLGVAQQPVLEVVSSDRGAVALDTRLGWRQVGGRHPEWLPSPDRAVLFVALERSET